MDRSEAAVKLSAVCRALLQADASGEVRLTCKPCAHPSSARRIFGIVLRSQVLTSVRPLLRPFICRRPVWEFANRVLNHSHALEAQCEKLVSRSRFIHCAPYFPFDPPTSPRTPDHGRLKLLRSEFDISPPSPVRPKLCVPSCWREQRSRASEAYVPASAEAGSPMGCRVVSSCQRTVPD
jgi:hypothetical protein